MEPEAIITKLTEHSPSILGSDQFIKYAILVPLIQKDDGIHILFEVRSLKLRRQPGEICFPGGKIDPGDRSKRDAALRETIEELGLVKEHISKVFPLDFLITPFRTVLYPFAGFINDPARIQPNPAEVGEIFTVPLSYFINNKPEIYHVQLRPEPEDDFPFDLVSGGQNYQWQTRPMEEYFYIYENRVIWGLTARILSHFIDLL